MAELLSSSDLELWSNALSEYKFVVQALEDRKNKRKGAKKDQESLTSLDTWLADHNNLWYIYIL